MRKYLIIALAAVTAIAFSAVAFAQAGPDTATLKIERHADEGRHQEEAEERHATSSTSSTATRCGRCPTSTSSSPKNVKLNLKGMPKCAPDVIFARSCPKCTVLGTGEAKAKVGVNGDPANVRDLIFEVTAYKTNSPVTGKEMLGFFIDDGASLQFLTETTLTKASGKYGQKLHIEVPELAQKVGTPPNVIQRPRLAQARR